MITTSAGEKTIEQLVNDLEAANQKIAEQEATITDLQAKVEAAKVEAPAPQTEVQQPVETQPSEGTEEQPETKPVENATEGTDADFKKDLNNALSATPKKVVVKVPDISFK